MHNYSIFWLAVSYLLGVSVRKLHAWLEIKGEYESLFASTMSDLIAFGFTAYEAEKIKSINFKKIESEVIAYTQQDTIITYQDPRYPRLLKEIADPPLVLYVRGCVQMLSALQIAMIGTRHPSTVGTETATSFAKALAAKGFIITSGLASGIDSACHKGALEVGGGTIAVMGTGFNQIYPRANKNLAELIIHQGALVSEFPLNTPPSSWNFPRRNRIISGLSVGVLVVEAAARSGSLITARHALEQNREVFAIPGSIHHPLSRGCHQLIRQGAKLVESAEDITEELPLSLRGCETLSRGNPPHPLLNYIDHSVTPFDLILLRCRLTAVEVSSILLSLELKGYVRLVPGGYIRHV